MPKTLHHVGYVVRSIAASAPSMISQLDLTWTGEITHDPTQRVRVSFLLSAVPGECQIELVEPADAASPVTRFLERGGGLHHVCYEVDAIEAELAHVRGLGATVLRPPRPAVAFGGRRIAWVLTSERLLVEYLERALP